MKNTHYYPLFIFSVLICSFACNRKATTNQQEDNKKESITATNAADIQGDWVIKTLNLTGTTAIVPEKYYTLTIKSESLGLPLDVNQCGTNYTVKEDSIQIEQFMTCTEMCCDSEAGVAISKFLSGPLHYSIQNGVLLLTHKKGTLALFKPATNLIGSQWEAVSYQPLDSDGKPTIFTKPYFLSFEPMEATIALDVNNCFGKVNYSKDAFEVKKGFGCSRKCCDSKDGTLLKNMLLGRNMYTIKEDKMMVTTDDSSIEFKKSNEKR